MKRIPDWETRFADFIHSRLRTPFRWGGQDCALFACDGVEAITGDDLAAEWRGNYSDAKSALAAMKNYAGGGIEELAEKKATEHGLAEVHLNLAGRGDLVLIRQDAEEENRLALGIISLDGRRAACAGGDGVHFVDREAWVKAWKI